MSRAHTVGIVAGTSLVLGAAAWASRAVLDEVVADGLRRRIALVPAWYSFAAFTLVGLLGAWSLHRGLARRRQQDAPAPEVADLLLPLLGLSVLLVPYAPGVPDRWPAVQMLAGPAKWIVWAIVAGQLLWTLVPHLAGPRRWIAARSLTSLTAAIWLATAAAATLGASRLTGTVLFPSGDEPHYLVIAQSLWRDGDLKIQNNHQRGDYREYFGRPLDPHYLARGQDGEIYSIHPVGMPVAIAPVYALGGYALTVAFFIVMGATAATVAWRWVVTMTGARGPATLAWAAVATSAPFLINTFTIYPEVPAALVMAVAMALVLRPRPDDRPWHGSAVGLLAATLPWLSTKYAPMSAALIAVALARRWWPLHRGERRGPWLIAAVPIVVPYALGLAAWFAFFYAYWGTPRPQAPYGHMTQTGPANMVFGVPGLLFDQEYGLLAYAPAYVLAAFGLVTMMRRAGPLRRLGLELAVLFGALIGTVGAFRIWWGGSAAPGRPLMSGLLLLLLPMAVNIGSARGAVPARAAQHLLVWGGAGLTAILVFAENGLLLANGRDGTSALLEWLSPRWPLWTLAPTFILHRDGLALADSMVWMTAAGAGAWFLARRRPARAGVASLQAMATAAAVVIVAVSARAVLPAADPPLPDIDLRARARLPALDSFDQVTRPYAVRYGPFRVDPSTIVEPTLAVSVAPGVRSGPQPVRVLHNGRFSLPAGRYRLVVRWASRTPLPADAGAIVALQVGRIGAPLHRWATAPASGATWSQEFWLPVDAGFVGFTGSTEVERSIDELRVEALDVVDAGVRTRTSQVLAAAAYGRSIVLFHDEGMYPESGGFWTKGQRRAQLTIACQGGCAHGVVVRAHSGSRPNRLRLATRGWAQDLELTGTTPIEVRIPPPADGGAIELDTETTGGFVPFEVDPASRDRRLLGAWIEVDAASEEPR